MCSGLIKVDTIESKETKTSILECKENGQMLRILDHKNVNKSKNRLAPLKLYSKKHHKKVMVLQEGLGWGDPFDRLGRALSHLLFFKV